MVNIRKNADGTLDVWTRWESDRVRVRKENGRWMMVGSFTANIYAPSSGTTPIRPKAARDIEAALA